MTRSRRIFPAALTLAGILLATQAQAQELKPWRHGLIEAKSDAGIYFMVTQGFAAKQGIKLEMDQFKSDSIGVKALLSGEIDSLEAALTGTVVAASKGIDVKLVGCHWPGLPHGIFVRNAINSVQDLRGKSFAISTPFSHPDELARGLLAKYNIPITDVRLVNMGGDVDRYKALVAGLVDATVVSSEYAPIAAKNGIKLLVPGRDVLPNYMRLCIFSTGKTLAAHHDAAAHFLAAEMDALHYALSHRAETLELTRKLTGIKEDDPRPAYIFDDAVATKGVDPDLSIPMDKIEWMEHHLVEEGNLAAPFDLGKLVDPTIRMQALTFAGKPS